VPAKNSRPLAEAFAFVESPEAPNSEKTTVGFRFRKRIRLGKDIRLKPWEESASLSVDGHGLVTSTNAQRESQERCAGD
jgi:hypothetical protein